MYCDHSVVVVLLMYCYLNHISVADGPSLLIIALSSLFLFFVYKWKSTNNKPDAQEHNLVQLPTNCPFLGMLPAILQNFPRIVTWLTDIQLQSPGGTFMLRGPWCSRMELLLTADPPNVQYIMSRRQDEFHKGSKLNDIFDYFGEGIFNVDNDKWKYQRSIAHTTFTSSPFRKMMAKTVKEKVEKGLIPTLERAFREGLVVDLQDLFTRFASDVTFMTIMGHDPGSLSVDLPKNPVLSYLYTVQEAVVTRHILPERVWKLQRWLRLGNEKRYDESLKGLDRIFMDCIACKKEELKKITTTSLKDIDGEGDHDDMMDLLTLYMINNYGATPHDHGFKSTSKFLRDTLATLLAAGQDTTSVGLAWFFWSLYKNPTVETNIKLELKDTINNSITIHDDGLLPLDDKVITDKLVYLHGALCESLRLYPPVPFNHKVSHKPLILPSGHNVKPLTMIILNAFAMGRNKSIWGDDCLELKPERWITDQGIIKNEPAHKFFTFNAGPRICLGKDIALMQMKKVISSILLHNFYFQVVPGQSVEPGAYMNLTMKSGLKVKVFKHSYDHI